jgi:hypothetical protein
MIESEAAFRKYITEGCLQELENLKEIEIVLERARGLGVRGYVDAEVALANVRNFLIVAKMTESEIRAAMADPGDLI